MSRDYTGLPFKVHVTVPTADLARIAVLAEQAGSGGWGCEAEGEGIRFRFASVAARARFQSLAVKYRPVIRSASPGQ
jgi:hypothetical protein